MNRCSACHTLVQETEPSSSCDECRQVFHASCWRELGGCSTYGCSRAAEARKPEMPRVLSAGWGDTKPCPACGATIGSGLLVCACGATFPYADPMTRSDYAAWNAKAAARAGVRRSLLWLFVGSLTGLAAPVTGAFAGWIAWNHREDLEGADGTYLAMGYGAASLGATYTLMIVLLLAGL